MKRTGRFWRLIALALAASCCWAWAAAALAADLVVDNVQQSGSHSLTALSKIEIRRLLDEAPQNLGGAALFTSQPSYTAPYAAGRLSDELQQRALARLNALRRIAGLPAVQLDASLSNKAQHTAVLMTATNYASGSGKPHEPEQPAGMAADFYAIGREGASSSNLYRATDLLVAIDFWLDDPGLSNLPHLGHRRWELNPTMGKVGFGYSAGTDYYNPCSVEWVMDQSGSCKDYDFVAWPAAGNFPADIFAKNAPWSVTLNPERFQQPDSSQVQVQLTRLADGRSWSFGGRTYTPANSGDYFNVNTQRFGVDNCIIFRPEDINLYDGQYQVEISGLKTADGVATAVAYTVDFFGAPRNFYDVRNGDYFAEPVRWAVSAGLVKGVSDNSFAPNATCTRGEIVTMLWRANGSPLCDTAEQHFNDLTGKYYRTAALWAWGKGLTEAPSFGGEQLCNRGEVVRYLWLLAGSPAAERECGFADVSADLAPAVAWAVEQGITTGATAESFEPETVCTRGQIATFLYRAYGR